VRAGHAFMLKRYYALKLRNYVFDTAREHLTMTWPDREVPNNTILLAKTARCYEGKCRLRLQRQNKPKKKISRSSWQADGTVSGKSCLCRTVQNCYCWYFAWLTLWSWRWRWYVPPKRRAVAELQVLTIQKAVLFIVTDCRTQNPAQSWCHLWSYCWILSCTLCIYC
jgi:hypothetical protein